MTSNINTPLLQNADNDQISQSVNQQRDQLSQGYNANALYNRTGNVQDMSLNTRKKSTEQSVLSNIDPRDNAGRSYANSQTRSPVFMNDTLSRSTRGGIARPEKRDPDELNQVLNTQESEDKKSVEIPFLTEPAPSRCINIQSLESEIEHMQKSQKESSTNKGTDGGASRDSAHEFGTNKKKSSDVDSQRPDKVYLKHCKTYSQKHMDKLKLKIENYRFSPNDYRDGLLSPVFFARLKQHRSIDFMPHKLSIEDFDVIFKTESMKLFVDYIFHEGEVMMIIKTWQKVFLRVPTQEAKKEKEGGRIIAVDHLRKNGVLQDELFAPSNNFFFIKTLQVYDRLGVPRSAPILLEQVFGAFDSFRIYDGSFMYQKGKLYYFKRLFLDRDQRQNAQSANSKSMKMSTSSNLRKNKRQGVGDASLQDSNEILGMDPEDPDYQPRSVMAATTKKSKDKVYLQMYSLDINTEQEEPITQVFIEEEDWDAMENEYELTKLAHAKKQRVKQSFGPMDPTRSQYHVQFSAEFGAKSFHETAVSYRNEWEFLSSQYFSIQKYITGQEFHPFRIFQVGDYGPTAGRLQIEGNPKTHAGLAQYLIANTNEKDKIQDQVDLNRQIQFVNHVKNFDQQEWETVNFLVHNMFIMAGIASTGPGGDVQLQIYRRKTVHQYQRIWNIGGIVPQKTAIRQYPDDEKKAVDQYFFTDSRNNIQLLMPNYESKLKCQRRVEQIRDATDFSNKFQDYLMYKKITVQRIGADGQCQCSNVFQKIDHLQSILDDDISCAQSFNFFEDSSHQLLYLSESKSRHVIIYKMKDTKFEICRSISSDAHSRDEDASAALQKAWKKASTKQLKEKKTQGRKLREEVCDIDNQTSQAIKGTRPDDLRRNRPNQACEIVDNDHDEPYASYQIKITEENLRLVQDFDAAGYGIIKLPPEEKRNYCLVDDFKGKKRKVKMYNFFESQQLRLISYVQAKHGEFCLFLFAVYNPDKNFDELTHQDQTLIKRSYIFVRKTHKEMLSIFESNGDLEIIRNDDEVIILKNWKTFEKIKFTEIKKYQFEESDAEKNDDIEENEDERQALEGPSSNQDRERNSFKELSLTLCKFQEDDKTQINFLPFIYQEKNNSDLNKFIVFDICNNAATEFLSMNPSEKQKDYVYENENGYNKFLICRSSDMYEQPTGSRTPAGQSSIYSKAKYSVFTLYSEKIGRMHCEEFIISHDSQHTKVETIGQKEILFSNKIISLIEWDQIRRSEVYPYLDNLNSCKGSKIKLIMGPNDEGAYINLVDGEDTNMYFYKSDVVLCGNMKMILKEDDHDMYITATATILRQEIIAKEIFNRSQAYEVLSIAQDLMMRMKIPNLEYLVLNSFEDIRTKNFFMTQEILQGKSISDISLSSAESWIEALSKFRQEWKVLDGCIVEKVIDGDRVRREHMQQCEFYPKLCIVQLDLNFMGTIERAFKLNSYKSLKVIFNHILDVIDTFEYQKFIMYELPIVIGQKQIQIDDFYNLSQAERKNTDKGFCNLEIELGQKEMPPFSDLEFDSFQIKDFGNFKQIEHEIAGAIWDSDKKKAAMGVKDADKKFETEYFYIDYHYMILGETLRSYRQGKPIEEFTDLLYAKIIASKVGESQRNSFFLQETIQKIIDSQWMRTKHIQKYIFLIYVLLYCIPMGMSCFKIMDSLMFNIAIWPAFVLLLIEAIQLREQGLQYFVIGWNLIDGAQLAVFGILYYMRYMGEDRNVLYFPELKLVNIILTFLKLLFFVRIFEDYGFLVQMIILCMQDLVPFFMTYLLFLNFFAMCFVVLNCDIDEEVADTPILSRYQLMLLQVYRTALGELSMPGYERSPIWQNGRGGDIFLTINIVVIWILWVVSTFFMFVIMTNFNIAQITSTYERVRGLEKKISYELKAEMNHETYMLLAIFTTLPSYRCIIFANTKNSQGKQTELLDDQFDQLKKSIMKNNQAFDGKNEEHMRKLKKVSDQQNNLRHFFKDKMTELVKRQEAMKITLLEDVHKRLTV